jgi:hypothetical protein
VAVTTAPQGAGRLHVTLSASGPHNALRTLRFGAATNATIEASGQRGAGNFTVNVAPGTVRSEFTLSRTTAGQAVTVPLTVTDGCGDWPTVVGGGPTAF